MVESGGWDKVDEKPGGFECAVKGPSGKGSMGLALRAGFNAGYLGVH